MIVDSAQQDRFIPLSIEKPIVGTNLFAGSDCVLKSCCKKYKKGKRCKKCPDR